MNFNGDGGRLRGLNHPLQGENKTAEVGIVSEEDFKVHDTAEKIKDRHGGALQAPPAPLQISQQQQSQGSTVCWERFLHLRTLKVLLVETDYSTRHVITALLRNCSYEVTEAANGLQAWKILADLTNQIDLVLTEVVMPGLSSIGLLHKIMTHKTRNNVPVIMMSSHDSMGIVFKCLSKGAVDFLVKPIRKNELKNLWQHVWRRCHSSSGSGSESGTQTQKSVKSKSVDKSDNNSGSNDEDDNGMRLNVADGSDNGSGTQSSWTKQAVAVDSPGSVSPQDQVAECPDSTCAQVIHSNGEVSGNKQAPVINIEECEGHEEQLDNTTCKEKEKRLLGNADLQIIHQVEDPIKLAGTKQKDLLEKGSGKLKEQIDKGHLDLNNETPFSISNYAANLTVPDANMKSTVIEASSRQSKISEPKNKALNDANQTASFEHGLKRLREEKDVGTAVIEDRNVLRRSDSSAFSRYNAPSNANKAPGVNIKSGSPLDSTSDKTRKGSVCDLQSHSNGDQPNQCSNRGSNNIDMGSTTNRNLPDSVVLKKYSTVSSSVKYLHPPSSFHLSKGDLLSASQQTLLKEADDVANKKMLAQSKDAFQEHQCQCLVHNCNHHNRLSHNMQQQQCCQQPELPTDLDATSLKKMTAAVPHCGSSNVLSGPVEGTGGNYYSINRSASGSNPGSNHGSNGQNGSSTVVNTGGTNLESDNGIAGKSGSGDGSGTGCGDGNRVDDKKFTQREAAVNKFRQKRNERCFRKKVRYHNRKRLAEQRPRVRGQFVRKTTNESSSKGTES